MVYCKKKNGMSEESMLQKISKGEIIWKIKANIKAIKWVDKQSILHDPPQSILLQHNLTLCEVEKVKYEEMLLKVLCVTDYSKKDLDFSVQIASWEYGFK